MKQLLQKANRRTIIEYQNKIIEVQANVRNDEEGRNFIEYNS